MADTSLWHANFSYLFRIYLAFPCDSISYLKNLRVELSSPLETFLSNNVCRHNKGAFQIFRLQIYLEKLKKVFLSNFFLAVSLAASSNLLWWCLYNMGHRKWSRLYRYFTYFSSTCENKLQDTTIVYFHTTVQFSLNELMRITSSKKNHRATSMEEEIQTTDKNALVLR